MISAMAETRNSSNNAILPPCTCSNNAVLSYSMSLLGGLCTIYSSTSSLASGGLEDGRLHGSCLQFLTAPVSICKAKLKHSLSLPLTFMSYSCFHFFLQASTRQRFST